MKKKNIIRFLSVALVTVLLCAAFAGCGAWDKVRDTASDLKDDVQNGAGVVGDLFASVESTPQIQLLASDADPMSESDLGKKLTATVLPVSVDPSLKLVDWSAFWIENWTGDEAAQVEDYLAVTPESDGSSVAYIKALQDFTGSVIGVRVTTREGGFSAVCTVIFVGAPTLLCITSEGVVVDETLTLTPGETYEFNLELDNSAHMVGSGFGSFAVESTDAVGSLTFNRSTAGGNSYSLTISDEYILSYNFFNISFNGDVLSINVLDPLFWNSSIAGPFIDSYESGIESVMFTVIVKEVSSDISTSFVFSIREVPSGVELDQSEIVF